METDVFVVGGGPAGLAAAIAARQKGMRAMVADARRPPIDKPCGEGLMPDTLAAAAHLGIRLPSAERSFRFRGIRFQGTGHAVHACFPTGQGVGIRRTVLHQILLERAEAAGVQFCWETPVTGIDGGAACMGATTVRARWIVGADGQSSRVRSWANLDHHTRDTRRFGFRRHYRVAPWGRYMEIHWGDGCQVYATPVAPDEVCVVLIGQDPHLRLEGALHRFPLIARHLEGAAEVSTERGAVTATRTLRAVFRGQVALVGDASGSVDAITGQGLSMVFQQAAALAEAMCAGDLRLYQAAHRRISRRPRFMGDFMLLLDRCPWLRERALQALASSPNLFAALLAMHVGELPAMRFAATAAVLGARMLALRGES